MNAKIAPLAPLTLTPSNSKGKNGLAPLATPENNKGSGGGKSTSKSVLEKKKARKAKMEKLREEKHATHIQAAWRGSHIRKECNRNQMATHDGAVGEITPINIPRSDSDVDLSPDTIDDTHEDQSEVPGTVTQKEDKNEGEEEAEENKERRMKDTEEVEETSENSPQSDDERITSGMSNVSTQSDIEGTRVDIAAAIIERQRLEAEAKTEEASVWPTCQHDTFVTIGDTDVPWPDLSASTSDDVLQWVLQHQQVLLRTVTWNMQAHAPPPISRVQQDLLPLNRFHIIGFGTEECERSIAKSAINPSKKVWESYLVELAGPEYIPLRSHTLQAIHLMFFVHKSIEPLITDVSSAAVACGMANTLGNKGGVGISFKIANSRMLILNTHLSAHQHKVEERNFQVWKILHEIPALLNIMSDKDDGVTGLANNEPVLVNNDESQEGSAADDKKTEAEGKDAVSRGGRGGGGEGGGGGTGTGNNGQSKSLSGSAFGGVDKVEKYFDVIVFMGDMNYRINGNRNIIDKLLAANMHEVLMSNDQLTVSFHQKRLPKFLTESRVTFRPTYKFNTNSDMYDTSVKRRIPSWTDRILYTANNLTCLNYNSVSDIRISDHRPVYGSFLARIIVQQEHVKHVDDTIAYSSQSQVCTIM